MKKLIALLLALVMVMGLVACGAPAEPTTQPTTKPTTQPTEPQEKPTDPPETPTEPQTQYPLKAIPVDNDPYIVPKYTEETTADGWVKVVNEGGATLGYHPSSGVQLIQVEGFAFKDTDRDGELDGYEDWRNSVEDRANDLVSQMTIEDMAPYTAHGGWGAFTTDPITEDNSTYAYIVAGGRSGVTRNSGKGVDHAIWTNNVQALAEAQKWAIPAFFSIDPAKTNGVIETLSLAVTMDTELAHEVGVKTSQWYRALGVAALLGPQVDLASPIMQRASGTYGEDPRLTRDIAQAYVNAMQSTYAEDGTDLGWGTESVYCFTKHFGGAGASEGGRDDHRNPGRYSVFPGDNYEAHIISYFDGVFDLPGLTGSAGVMPQYAINVGADGEPYGGEWGGSYNPFNMGLLTNNWDGLAVTDWGIINGVMAIWGVEDWTESERIARIWEMGGMHLGLQSDIQQILDAIPILQENVGEDRAYELLYNATYQFVKVEMNLGLFENPYNDTAYTAEMIGEAEKAFGASTQEKAMIMLKNDGTVAQATDDTKKTVYVPAVYTPAKEGRNGVTPASWSNALDVEMLSKYFNVVTDTIGDPTGEPDADGNKTYTENDVVRADLTGVDMILVPMTAPYTGSSLVTAEDGTETWYPASLQYAEYTATTAREVSIGGKVTENVQYDNYGSVISKETIKENRSYKDMTVGKDANYDDLELLQWADSVAGDASVVAIVTAGRACTWFEAEPLADVILLSYTSYPEVAAKILAGQIEPYGLLPMQQPLNMEEVEAQYEDVPRDMKCYVDANGNTYDFAFGLNWSGVINDERVQTYSQAPLTEVENDIVWPEK